MIEKKIEREILDWLKLQPGVLAIKMNRVGIYDPVKKVFRKIKNPHIMEGLSDILACVDGRFLAIEVKQKEALKKAQKVKPIHYLNKESRRALDQRYFLERVRKIGGYAIYATTLEEVMQEVSRIKQMNQK